MNGPKGSPPASNSSGGSFFGTASAALTSGRTMALVAWVSLWLLATLAYLGGPGRAPFAQIAAGQFDVGVAIELVSVILVVLLIWVGFALTWKGLKAVAVLTSPAGVAKSGSGGGQKPQAGAPAGGAGGTQDGAGQAGTAAKDERPRIGFPAPPTVAVALWLIFCGLVLTLGLIQVIASVFPIGEYYQSLACVGEGSCADLHNILVTMFAAGVGAVITTTMGFLEHASEKRDFDPSFVAWFIARPILGVLLGAVFYFVLKGGLLATVGTQNASTIDVYGLAAFGALVGMFSKRAITKLRELFDTLFVTKPESSKKGEGGDGNGEPPSPQTTVIPPSSDPEVTPPPATPANAGGEGEHGAEGGH